VKLGSAGVLYKEINGKDAEKRNTKFKMSNGMN
jgi:hypothetical protein